MSVELIDTTTSNVKKIIYNGRPYLVRSRITSQFPFDLFTASNLKGHCNNTSSNVTPFDGDYYYSVGRFDSIDSIREYIILYDPVPNNMAPICLDEVKIKTDRLWYFTPLDSYMSIESIGKQGGSKSLIEAHCCKNPSRSVNELRVSASFGGGPWCSVDVSLLKPTDEYKDVFCWDWGIFGVGGHMGVYYTRKVKVWELWGK